METFKYKGVGGYTREEMDVLEKYEKLLSAPKRKDPFGSDILDKEFELVLKERNQIIDDRKANKNVDTEDKNKDVPYNPYVDYLEKMRLGQEANELGLLNAQSDANMQNAEIIGQQNMMQQSQLKNQIIEQIKGDRLGKMRSGLTPMQIAQEELQMTVGNMQMNSDEMKLINQQRLMGTQQKAMNPYQAYINANAAVTGGQGYGNIATGFGATDAGDLYMQANRIGNKLPNNTFQSNIALAAAKDAEELQAYAKLNKKRT